MGAIAQTQQAISRAVAQFATQGLFPACDMASRLSRRRRSRFAARLDAAGATPWPGLGFLGWRVDIGTCHDASTSARLTWEFPARVIPPRDSVSPLERSEGASPPRAANDGALGNLEKSPASAASRNAVATSTPFTRHSASTVGAHSGREAASTTLRSSSLLASPQRSTASV